MPTQDRLCGSSEVIRGRFEIIFSEGVIEITFENLRGGEWSSEQISTHLFERQRRSGARERTSEMTHYRKGNGKQMPLKSFVRCKMFPFAVVP